MVAFDAMARNLVVYTCIKVGGWRCWSQVAVVEVDIREQQLNLAKLEGWKVATLRNRNVARLEDSIVGRLKLSKGGRLEGRKSGKLQGWKDERLEGCKSGRLQDWKVKGFQTVLSSSLEPGRKARGQSVSNAGVHCWSCGH
jgi:hypothetical protein